MFTTAPVVLAQSLCKLDRLRLRIGRNVVQDSMSVVTVVVVVQLVAIVKACVIHPRHPRPPKGTSSGTCRIANNSGSIGVYQGVLVPVQLSMILVAVLVVLLAADIFVGRLR